MAAGWAWMILLVRVKKALEEISREMAVVVL
jgi:hypothetical protein